jgi:predicted  nucleic acid-binding Zn-ribbon protein
VLRQAKNKKALDSGDYAALKKKIFEEGKDVREVKRDLTALMKEREELEPEEAWEKRRLSTIRRFVGVLKSLKQEIEGAKLLPAPLIKEAANLIRKLEAELSL